jgi:hypothetical protein
MMKIQSSTNGMLNSIVDKIYNLLFGWLDSLFDDENYDKEESKIPKSKVETPKEVKDEKDQPVPQEDVEVKADAKVIHLLPKEVEGKETPDEFTVKVIPIQVKGDDAKVEKVLVSVVNNATGKESLGKIVSADDNAELKSAIEKCKKEVSASCKIGLHKVTGSSGIDLQLTNISSSYDMMDTLADISAILNDSEFQDSVPEGDSVYRIDSDADGYEVDAIENFEFAESIYAETLDCCIKTVVRIQELSWFAKGIDYSNFKSMCDSLTYSIQYNITELAKLCIIHNVAPKFEVKSSDASSALDKWQSLKECVTGYITMLNALALASTPDETQMIENWIRALNDMVQYQYQCLHPEAPCIISHC